MSHVVAKQPDGLFALWSTIVDDFILIDATREQIIKFEIDKDRRNLEMDRNKWFDDSIRCRYLSFEDMVETRKLVHEGSDEEEK